MNRNATGIAHCPIASRSSEMSSTVIATWTVYVPMWTGMRRVGGSWR